MDVHPSPAHIVTPFTSAAANQGEATGGACDTVLSVLTTPGEDRNPARRPQAMSAAVAPGPSCVAQEEESLRFEDENHEHGWGGAHLFLVASRRRLTGFMT
ncbi:MAG: hypothetical protein V1750_02625 [Acidobacteriota bacterium]